MNFTPAVHATSHNPSTPQVKDKTLTRSPSTLQLVFREHVEPGSNTASIANRKIQEPLRVEKFTKQDLDVKKIHISILKDLLNVKNDVCPFIPNLQTQFAEFIKQGAKPLTHAACDLWRICSKLNIERHDDELVTNVLKSHPDAYNDKVPEDVEELNRRFLLLLSCFQNTGFTLPQSADWKGIEDVVHWVKNNLQIAASHPLARFIRSCSQERYNGVHIENAVLTNYGLTPEQTPPPPILVSLQAKRLSSTRVFFSDQRHEELLIIPMQVLDRSERSELCTIAWKLRFCYDKECCLEALYSSTEDMRE